MYLFAWPVRLTSNLGDVRNDLLQTHIPTILTTFRSAIVCSKNTRQIFLDNRLDTPLEHSSLPLLYHYDPRSGERGELAESFLLTGRRE